jgi:tetratricopeptide (TPR) repeat protein
VDALGADRSNLARRTRVGRLALGLSVVFLIVMVRLPAWSAYLELLNQSKFIRELILRDDLRRFKRVRAPAPPRLESRQVRDLEVLTAEASRAWNAERYTEAKNRYLRMASIVETIPQPSLTSSGRYSVVQALNGCAWMLATCPDEALRSPRDAVTYARRALELEPNDGEVWNTLGVAYYRLGNLEEARNAFYRSMELHDEGNAFDWFFLAMIHHKLGHKDRARTWYDKAVQWSHQMLPGNAELYRFQVETAQLLGLPKPDRIPPPPAARMFRSPIHPMNLWELQQRPRWPDRRSDMPMP